MPTSQSAPMRWTMKQLAAVGVAALLVSSAFVQAESNLSSGRSPVEAPPTPAEPASVPLLTWIGLLWVALISTVVISPFIPSLVDAGTYGKLKSQVTAPKAAWRRLSLHPALYVRTSTAFTSYYALASAWNGALLLECTVAYCTSSFDHTPILRLVRTIAHEFLPASLRPSTDGDLSALEPMSLLLPLLQLSLFQAHLMRRLYESLTIANFSSRSQQHFIVTAMAYLYYFLCSLTPVVDSPFVDSTAVSVLDSWTSLRLAAAAIGMALYVGGSIGQHRAHCILAGLRDGARSSSASGDRPHSTASSYSIPFGSLFAYVSMPHYFCEMVEYTGLWLVSGFKLSQFLICLWVYSNLSITAVRSHRWYRQRFPNYPRHRKAVIPGIL